MMLKNLRQSIIKHLWQQYCASNNQMQKIESALRKRGVSIMPQDHFAIIDLPGSKSGIPTLKSIFELLGFEYRGQGYLPAKQNDFLWLAETAGITAHASDALPQVVVADFRPDLMPLPISNIIKKYAEQSATFPIEKARQLIERLNVDDNDATTELFSMITSYLAGRDWPLPTVADFTAVKAFNELLAWVLVFGRQANHFTLSVHLLNAFDSIEAFHHFIETDVQLELNKEGGVIKGGESVGMSQGSTMGQPQRIRLADGEIELPTGFVEFVWRFPATGLNRKPIYWNEYFNDFIPQHADNVIESLYTETNDPTN